jgi:hypothetical protein
MELMMVILGIDCVSREDKIKERNKAFTEDTPSVRIETRIRSNPIVVGKTMYLKNNTVELHAATARLSSKSDAPIITFVSSVRPSEKVRARKRVLPKEIPRSTIVLKMSVREITVEDTPITSRVVILERINHKKYPIDIVIMLSM